MQILRRSVEDMLVVLCTKKHTSKNDWIEQSPITSTPADDFIETWNMRVREMRATIRNLALEEAARGIFHLSVRFWDEQLMFDSQLSPHISKAEDFISNEEFIRYIVSELIACNSELSCEVKDALRDAIQTCANSLRTRLELSLHQPHRWRSDAGDLRVLYMLSDFPQARELMMSCRAQTGAMEVVDDGTCTRPQDTLGGEEEGIIGDVIEALQLSFQGLRDLRTDTEKEEGRPVLEEDTQREELVDDVIGFELSIMQCLHILARSIVEPSSHQISLLLARRSSTIMSEVAVLAAIPAVIDVFSFAFSPIDYTLRTKEHKMNSFFVHIVECAHAIISRAKSGEGKPGARGDLWITVRGMIPPDPHCQFWTATANAIKISLRSKDKEVADALTNMTAAFAADD